MTTKMHLQNAVRILEEEYAVCQGFNKDCTVPTLWFRVSNKLKEAKERLSLFEANELASEDLDGVIRRNLETAIKVAVRGRCAEEWASEILEALERSQACGGITVDDLKFVHRGCFLFSKGTRWITDQQAERVWSILLVGCPDRGLDEEGECQLGTPYKVKFKGPLMEVVAA